MRICLIGSGSLSLGLLCPWFVRLPDCELCVITRRGSMGTSLQAARAYRLQLGPTEPPSTESLPQVLTYSPDNLEDAAAVACVREIEQVKVAAVCAGVGQIPAVARLIAKGCLDAHRPPLHLLAFENLPHASHRLLEAVKSELASLAGDGATRHLIPHLAIPDRACSRRMEEGSVLVTAERFAEIVLEDSAAHLFGETLPQTPCPAVRYVATDAVALGEMRKFWLVNGTHTALGILCAEADLQLLRYGLADEQIAGQMRGLHEEWVHVLHNLASGMSRAVGVFEYAELADYARKMFERLKDLPDFSLRDVLRELTDLGGEAVSGLHPLHRLFQKLDDRLADAVRSAANEGRSVPVPRSGHILATGVGTVRWYADTYLGN